MNSSWTRGSDEIHGISTLTVTMVCRKPKSGRERTGSSPPEGMLGSILEVSILNYPN